MAVDTRTRPGGTLWRWLPVRVDRRVIAAAWATLVVQIGIVGTGGLVRLTGSGLGCPTWPQCTAGSFVATPEMGVHGVIEFGNRLLTFVLAALALAAIIGALAWWRRQRRSGGPARGPVLALAAIPIVGTVVQAVLGGITVLTGLSPWAVGAHFLVSIGIIAGCVALVVRSGEPGDRPVTRLVCPEVRLLGWALVWVTLVVVVLGVVVTGSGPHSGDADTEARFGFDPRTVAWLHADAVLLFLGLTAGFLVALRVTRAPARTMRLTLVLLGVALAQGVIGYAQYFSGLPWALVAIHMLGACLVWTSVVFVALSMRARGPVSPDADGASDSPRLVTA